MSPAKRAIETRAQCISAQFRLCARRGGDGSAGPRAAPLICPLYGWAVATLSNLYAWRGISRRDAICAANGTSEMPSRGGFDV